MKYIPMSNILKGGDTPKSNMSDKNISTQGEWDFHTSTPKYLEQKNYFGKALGRNILGAYMGKGGGTG